MSRAEENNRLAFSKDNFQQIALQEIIEQAEEKDCVHYSTLFSQKAKECGDSDKVSSEILLLLAQITSLYLNHESNSEPFGPMAVMDGYRTAIIDDFTVEQLNALEVIVSDIEDAELRARVADVLWAAKRIFSAALLAVDAYLESANSLEDPERWTCCAERIERALKLSASLGRGGTDQFKKVIQHIENRLQHYDGNDPLYLSCRLMEYLIDFGQGDSATYSKLAEKVAYRAEEFNDFHRARAYWNVKARWHEMSSESEGVRDAKIKAAATYASEADVAGNSLAAASFIEQAIEAYRGIGSCKAITDQLYKRLLDFQQGTLGEMQKISTEVDLTEIIDRSVEHVKGKSLEDALVALGMVTPLVRFEKLKEEVADLAKNNPLQFLISGSLLDAEGKVVAKLPSMMSSDPAEVELAIYANAVRQSNHHHSLTARGCIDPARKALLLEHSITLGGILPYMENNPLIRHDREYLVAKGLVAGLHGEWDVAMHILIPQFEDSVRYLLQNRGETVSGMDPDGTQDDRSLNTTLKSPAIENAFGVDLTFNLKALLIDRYGSNMRNNVAHGLLPAGSFYSAELVYIWWLLFRLYLWPLIAQRLSSESDS